MVSKLKPDNAYIYANKLCHNLLTHWGRDNMPAIFPDDIFKWIFLNKDV